MLKMVQNQRRSKNNSLITNFLGSHFASPQRRTYAFGAANLLIIPFYSQMAPAY